MKEFPAILEQFQSIGLSEMKSVELMNRVDTKFIFHQSQLPELLRQLRPQYKILEIGAARLSSYKNLYFDTPDLKFYHEHHNGKLNRTKIRMRQYIESNICFVEIKQKSNKGRTKKLRQQIPNFEQRFSSNTAEFLKHHTADITELKPVLWNQFKRLTLVSLENQERITIDMELVFDKDSTSLSYDNLVIAELKQASLNRNTPLFKVLKAMHINPYRISKYCIGMIGTHDNLKKNVFKEKVMQIHKINS